MAKRAGFILCLVVCALGGRASHARADGVPPAPVIADGVHVGSVAVGGMTADQATTAVQQAYLAPVVLHVGQRNVSVTPRRLHTALAGLAVAVQTALTAPSVLHTCAPGSRAAAVPDGHSESHGCIRMQVVSAEWLYNRVRIGTPVLIVPV